jgi:hypothetical protein
LAIVRPTTVEERVGAKMNEAPTLGSCGERVRVAHSFSFTRLFIYLGAAGTLMLALNGFRVVLGRLSQRGAMSELVVVVPLWAVLGVWILSPYWGALRLHRLGPTTRGEGVLVVCAVLALVALAANSFLMTSAFVGGRPHPTADGVTIALIPIAQWVVLGGAGVLLRLGRALRHRRQTA